MSMKTIRMMVLALLMTAQGLAWGGFDEGLDALHHGQYEAALKEWKPLAEQGDVEAQIRLGYLYFDGLGVNQDYKEGVRWFRKAAEQGAFNRYYNLGFLYENGGYGLPKDYVQAYMWYSLDIPLYRDDFNDIHRIRVMEKMTPAQITEGRQLAKEWIVEHPYPKP
jgi:hypothetical protein